MAWVKWHDKQGVKINGKNRYNLPQPWGPWTKIMGVVARCEGNHDTVISYDGTGITWGFMQWTFTSGRLQRLLEYLKSVECVDFTDPNEDGKNLFDEHFAGKFENFGFSIRGGKFRDDRGNVLNPAKKAQKGLIDDICMGRTKFATLKDQKSHATRLAKVFAEAGKDPDVAFAQIEFAKGEFKRAIKYKRKPLGKYETIANLLDGTWDSHVPAVFFNLWQNSPAAAYRLFVNSKNLSEKEDRPLDEVVWSKLKGSKFANWSYKKPGNKSPRIARIAKAVKEFYGLDLPVR